MHQILHVLVILGMPPLLLGVITKAKAVVAGRVGPPVLQPYYDLIKLFQKGLVLSKTTTWVFLAGPVVGLATSILASMLMPLGSHAAPISFEGDLILFLYLLALGRFFTTLAALDTGSAFEGMGAGREVTFACLAEPAVFFSLLVLAKFSGSLSLTGMFHEPLSAQWDMAGASLVLVSVSLFIVLLVENCRIPFDDPNTHLELTMIHEVMVLDHSGPLLGMILYGSAIKLFALGAFIIRVALPLDTGNLWLDWLVFLPSMLVLAVIIGLVESTMARLRLLNIPKVLVAACLLSAFGLVLVLK